MTRAEFIERLKKLIEEAENDGRTAESAQNVPNGDLISRQAAIEAICTEGTRLERNGTVAMAEIKQWCVDILEALPSAQPEQRWIPCSERLPEEDVYVLLCDGEDDESYGSGAYSRMAVGWLEDGQFRCWDDRTHMSEIVAWMPLPKPYKEDKP